MIKVKPGYERSIYGDLQKRPEITDIYPLFGDYDFFLVMRAEGKKSFDQLLEDIKEEEKVIKMGPILITQDSDLINVGVTTTTETAFS